MEAGGALAVDRYGFSQLVTQRIHAHPLITVTGGEATEIPAGPAIIATGPLTSDAMAEAINRFFDGCEPLSFYDAAAPLVAAEGADVIVCGNAVFGAEDPKQAIADIAAAADKARLAALQKQGRE